jgi:hypothetical protein
MSASCRQLLVYLDSTARALAQEHKAALASVYAATPSYMVSPFTPGLGGTALADLPVMGCYGHSRAREWVMGGATRTILRSMTLPVLMAH